MKISNMFKKIGSAAFLALSLAATTAWGGVRILGSDGTTVVSAGPLTCEVATAQVKNGETIQLIDDTAENIPVGIEQSDISFKLDLNGHKLKGGMAAVYFASKNVKLTIFDSQSSGGEITASDLCPVIFDGDYGASNCELTLESGKIAYGSGDYPVAFCGVCGAKDLTVNIKGGEVTLQGRSGSEAYACYPFFFGKDIGVGDGGNARTYLGGISGSGSENVTINITGGKINSEALNTNYDGVIYFDKNLGKTCLKISGQAEISDNNGKCLIYGMGKTGSGVAITGGTFKGTELKKDVNTYLAKDGKELDAEGHVVKKQGGGDVPGGDVPGGDVPGGDEPGGDVPGGDEPVVPADAVAQIGNEFYKTVEAAFMAAKNLDTIKLLKNCNEYQNDDTTVFALEDKLQVRLDLNGFQLKADSILVRGDQVLTVCDNKGTGRLVLIYGVKMADLNPKFVLESGNYGYHADQAPAFMGTPAGFTKYNFCTKYAVEPVVEIKGGVIAMVQGTSIEGSGFVDFDYVAGKDQTWDYRFDITRTSGGKVLISGGEIQGAGKPLVSKEGNTSPVTVSVTGGTFTGDETFLNSVKAAAGEGNYVEETGKVMVKKAGPEGHEVEQPVIVDATAELTAKYGEVLAKKVMDAAQTFAATAGETGLENAPIADGGKLVDGMWAALKAAAGDEATFFDDAANNSVSGLKTKAFVQIKPVDLAVNERGEIFNGKVINKTSFEVRPMVSVEVNDKVIATQIPNGLLPEGGVTFRLGLSNDFRSNSGKVIVTQWNDAGDAKIQEKKIKKGGDFDSFFVECSATTFAPRFDVANYDTAEDEGYGAKVDMRPDDDEAFAGAPMVVVNLSTGIEYPTLQRAFDNVTNGQILKLLTDVAGSTWGDLQVDDMFLAKMLHQTKENEIAFILDLNGKSITWNGLAAFCLGSNVHMTLTDMSELDENGKRHGSVTANTLVTLQGENPWFTLEEGKIVYGTGDYAFCFWAFDQFGGSNPIYVGQRTPKNPKVDVLGGEILMNEYLGTLDTTKLANYVFMFGAYCSDDNLRPRGYAWINSFGGTSDGGTVVIKGGFFHGLSTDISQHYDGLVYFKGNIGKPTLDVSGCEMEIWTADEDKKSGLFVTKTENAEDTAVRVVGGTFKGSKTFQAAVAASLTARCEKMKDKVVKYKEDGSLFIDPLPNGPEVETDPNAPVAVRTSAGTIRTDETSERVAAKIKEVTDVIGTATVQTGVKETLVYQADGKMTSGARDAFLGANSTLTDEQKAAIQAADETASCEIDMYLHIDPVEVRVDDVEQDVDGDMLPTTIVRGVVFNVKPYLCTSVGTERVSVEIPNTMLPMQGLTFRLGMPPDFQQTPEVKVIHWSGRKGEEGSVILDNRPYPIFVDDTGFKYVEMTFYHFCDFELNNSFIYPSDPVYENTGKAEGNVDFIDARPGARLVAVPCSPTVGYNGSNPDHPLFRFATSTNDWGSVVGGQPVEIDVSVNGGAATKLCDVTADEDYDWGTSQNGVYTFSYKYAGAEKQTAVFYATDLITQIGSNGTVVAVLDGEGNVTRLDVTLTTNIVQQLVVNETVPVKFNIGEYSIVGPDGTDYTAENRDGRSAILVAEGVPENVTIEIVGTGSIGGGDAYEGSGAAKGGLPVGWGSNLGVPPELRVVYGEYVKQPTSLDGLQYKLDAVRQRYPWNGKVDVVYTLSNRGLDSAGGYEATIEFTGADATYTAKLEGATFEKGQNHGLCDVSKFMPKGLDKQAFRCKLFIKRRAQ